MVKFSELLEYIGMIQTDTICSCCDTLRKPVYVYKVDENMVVLCEHCKDFLEGLLE